VATKSDKQFKRALEAGARYTVKLERTTAGEIMSKCKDLKSREESIRKPADLIEEARRNWDLKQ
jgi:hypothetical protein